MLQRQRSHDAPIQYSTVRTIAYTNKRFVLWKNQHAILSGRPHQLWNSSVSSNKATAVAVTVAHVTRRNFWFVIFLFISLSHAPRLLIVVSHPIHTVCVLEECAKACRLVMPHTHRRVRRSFALRHAFAFHSKSHYRIQHVVSIILCGKASSTVIFRGAVVVIFWHKNT